MNETDGSNALEYYPLVGQEVRRRLALGVPRGVDRSDLESRADEALIVAVARGTRAIRLAIRCALQNVVRDEALRLRFTGAMPNEAKTPRISPDAIVELVYDLTPRQSAAVRLVYYEGLTYAEAAAEINCTEDDVDNLLRAAIQNLRESLRKLRA